MTPEQRDELEYLGNFVSVGAMISAAADFGVSLPELLRHIRYDFAVEEDGATIELHGDWVAELAELLGPDVLQDALRTAGRSIEVTGHFETVAHTARLRTLLNADDLAGFFDAGGADWMLPSWLDRSPLELILPHWERFPEHLLHKHLGRRFIAIDLWAALADARGAPFADRLVPADHTWLEWWLAEHKAAGRTLWIALPRVEARVGFAEWLPVYVAHGFQPSFAALAGLERGFSVADTASRMVAAGVSSDLGLSALSECGAGPIRVLRELHAADWSPVTLVSMARASGQMDVEIRARLAELRVPPAQIESLLTTALI